MKIRVTIPDVITMASAAKSVQELDLTDVALTDELMQAADKVEVLNDAGNLVKTLKDRHGPTG